MKLSGPVKVIIGVLMVLYPVFIFLSLVVFHLPMSIVSIGMLIMGVVGYLANAKGNWYTPAIIGAIALIVIITNSELVLKFYPICITLVFLGLFGGSLIKKDPIVTHFATMIQPEIKDHPGKKEIEKYCKNVTWFWCGWFVISLFINIWLIIDGTTEQWAVYNGLICYLCQGAIFVGEFIVRYFVNNRIDTKYNMPHQGMFAMFKSLKKKKETVEK